jgi:hypothetical protein
MDCARGKDTIIKVRCLQRKLGLCEAVAYSADLSHTCGRCPIDDRTDLILRARLA